ncbi:MAG: glycosyltransferase [Candidatus Limnocylindria bacterium]
MVTEAEIRILQVVGNLERGGGQEVVRTLVRNLLEVGVSPVVASLADGPLRAEIEASGVPVVVVRGRTRSILKGPPAMREFAMIRHGLLEVARTHRTSVVQTHLLRSLDFLALTLRWDPQVVAVFWTIHNALLDLRADQLPGRQWLLGPKRAAHRALYRIGGRTVDAFIAVSADVGANVRASYRPSPGRLIVIPNGVDTERYGPAFARHETRQGIGIPAHVPLAIVVAKLMTQKGHEVLLDALPSVLEQFPELHTVLVGDGELRDSLEGRVRNTGLAGRVAFLGNRPDIPALLAASDLFVLPSLWEGLPMALLEAMASGLPVVATAVSGTRDVVQSDRSGVLVAPGNAQALAEGMTKVLADASFASSLGDAARARVEDCYSARAQALRHAQLYRSRLNIAEGGGN